MPKKLIFTIAKLLIKPVLSFINPCLGVISPLHGFYLIKIKIYKQSAFSTKEGLVNMLNVNQCRLRFHMFYYDSFRFRCLHRISCYKNIIPFLYTVFIVIRIS